MSGAENARNDGPPNEGAGLDGLARVVDRAVGRALESRPRAPRLREVGHVVEVGQGVAVIDGLPGASSEELLRFPDDRYGLAFDLDRRRLGVILLDPGEALAAGDRGERTGRVLDVPVGDTLLGRTVDPLGRPLDGGGAIRTRRRLPVAREAPAVLDRSPVSVPLQTGVKVIDALFPVGRGQRELILGDRQTGKTALAIDTILNQRDTGVLCVYCSIGQRSAATARAIATLRERGALEYTTVVVAAGESPPGLRYVAPYAATSLAEHFVEAGRDVLIVYDDLTRHARAYRELSLLLRRPPGREAYPGDIFYIHSRLLERSTHLADRLGGGSLTALPVIETEAQNLSAYIPTNLISITDGQIYLSPQLFRRGQLPAVEVGRSVSRVGGKAQLPAFRTVTGDLRLAYAQFEELERFSRYGTRLEERMRRQLEHGRRVRAVLRQTEHQPLPVAEQVAVLLATAEGVFDDLPVERVEEAEHAVRERFGEREAGLSQRIAAGERLSDEDRKRLLRCAEEAVQPLREAGAERTEGPEGGTSGAASGSGEASGGP